MTGRPIRWIHLSDLHLGSPGRELWPSLEQSFGESVAELVQLQGPPDLIFLTGDLSYSGRAEEFERVDAFLDRLERKLSLRGAEVPLLLPVPGNHDLAWPDEEELHEYTALDAYEDPEPPLGARTLRKLFFEKGKTDLLRRRFASYLAWWERRVAPRFAKKHATLRRSPFPGDFSVELTLPDTFPFAVVGLNSTWLQVHRATSESEFERRLAIEPQQLHLALDPTAKGDPLAFFTDQRPTFLLLHHPPTWLSPRAQSVFESEIAPPDRFALTLFGHLHEARSHSTSVSGGPQRLLLQAPSFCGLEHYGTRNEARRFGWTYGTIARDGELRIWPKKQVRRGDGTLEFDRDDEFARHAEKDGLLLCAGRTSPQAASTRAATAPRPKAAPTTRSSPLDQAIQSYVAWAKSKVEFLDMGRLGAADVRLPFDSIYVALQCRPHGENETSFDRATRSEHDLQAQELIDVDALFRIEGRPQPHRILIGEPGSGKSTALKKMLRALLHGEAVTYGFPAHTVPLLLPLHLLHAEGAEPAPTLVAALQRHLSSDPELAIPSDFVEQLFRRGGILLLLDGLDELGTEDRIFAACQNIALECDAPASERGVRAVISSRSASYVRVPELEKLAALYHLMPLDEKKVERFVSDWFAFAPIDQAQRLERKRTVLDALAREPYTTSLRAMARTPLLLALLCVLAYKEKRMPEDRASFYDECLDVLLKKLPRRLTQEDALRYLRAIAYRLHEQRRRDDLREGELRNWLEVLGAEDAESVRIALHQDTGVLDETKPAHYGFAHHTFQEYLSALHAVAESTADASKLSPLTLAPDDAWWREVFLLGVALPKHSAFDPLLRALLRGSWTSELLALVNACLTECSPAAFKPEPFVEALSNDSRPVNDRIRLLQLLLGRREKELVAWASEAKSEASGGDWAKTLNEFLHRASTGRLASTEDRPLIALIASPGARSAFEDYSRRLRDSDRRVWPAQWVTPGSPEWVRASRKRLDEISAAIVILTPSHEVPWSHADISDLLEALQRRAISLRPLQSAPFGHADIALPKQWDWQPLDFFDTEIEIVLGSLEVRAAREVESSHVLIDRVLGFRYLWVPDGEFTMGDDALDRDESKPAHRVNLSGFWLAETSVTNAHYDRFRTQNPNVDEPMYRNQRRFSAPDQPVIGVSWTEAKAFCRWLAQCSARDVGLPSEAQREYATRGLESRRYAWGAEEPNKSLAVFGERELQRVGSCPAGKGPFGHLDLAGNVWEWCEDAWGGNAYVKRAKKGKATPSDPMVKGPDKDMTNRVCRGGCWADSADNLLAAVRGKSRAGDRDDDLG
ncbi:MAG: SUMF1/EgtB/PvdO family nonheme iron enzyme, partial [Planctomycetes bacterium]|nr:SUMF1/EgtB/PvdO family nonheme iron enzyme [Planctomycetota bacterium]